MISVNIVKLGVAPVTAQVAANSTALQALVAGGFDVDNIKSLKRNGAVIAMDTVVNDGDMLLVSTENIKGGTDEDEGKSAFVASFEIEITDAPTANDKRIAFLEGTTLQDLVKTELHKRGYSFMNFVGVKNSAGNNVGLGEIAAHDEQYTIVVRKNLDQDEEYDD